MAKRNGAKGQKIGRGSRSPSNKFYKAVDKASINKVRRIARHKRRMAKKAEKLARRAAK